MRSVDHLGFGCGRIRGGTEEINSRKVLTMAGELGITHFDLAPSYGEGNAERIVGDFLKGAPKNIRVFTKVGLKAPPNSNKLILSAKQLLRPYTKWILSSKRHDISSLGIRHDGERQKQFGFYSQQFVIDSISTSFEKLGRSTLDGLLLHEPPPNDPQSEVIELLEKMTSNGSLKIYGVGTGDDLRYLPKIGKIRQFVIGPSLLSANFKPSEISIGHGLLRYYPAQFRNSKVFHSTKRYGVDVHSISKEFNIDRCITISALLGCLLIKSGRLNKIIISSHRSLAIKSFTLLWERVFSEVNGQDSSLCDSTLRLMLSDLGFGVT